MSLQIWLPLTKGSELNNQGLSDLTFTSSGVALDNSTGLGSCYNCGGSGYLVSNKKIDLGKNQSMFCWVHPSAFNSSSNLTGVCGQHRYSNCTGIGLTLKYASASTGYLAVATGTGNGRDFVTKVGKTLLSANKWYHIGYTYDGSTINLYLNGKLDASYSASNLAIAPDFFQAFQWSLHNTSNGLQGGYVLNGRLNDIRVYDHCLSQKEISEISKGLMVHYTFRRNDYDTINNVAPIPIAGASIVDLHGWDKTLHKHAIGVSTWSTGYNGGVTNSAGTKDPEKGYHAHWQLMDGIPTMVFPKLNYSVAGVVANRWLGINSGGDLSSKIGASTTYTVSFEAMADTPGRTIYGGYYYCINNASSNAFHDGSYYAYDIPVGEWKKYSFTFTTKSTLTTNRTSSMYFYGHSGDDGIAYVRNIQIEVGAVAHSFVSGSKAKEKMVYDASGMQYNGNIGGSSAMLISSPATNNTSNSDSLNFSRNYYSASFNGATYLTYDTQLAIPENYTMSFWIKKSGSGHIIDWRSLSGGVGVQPMYFNGSAFQYYSSAGGSAYFNYQFADNVWYHITLVATASTVQLYVNGELEQNLSATQPTGTIAALHLGCRVSYSNVSTFSMRDFKIFATALAEEDVKQLYQKPIAIDNKQNIFASEFKEG